MAQVYIITGSNVGNALLNLKAASDDMIAKAGLLLRSSAYYRTEPWGNKDQQPFLNQVLVIETDLPAKELLQRLLGIEEQMGRVRKNKWEPRIIDIDILFYGDKVIDEEGLTIPHPYIQERRFVLTPLVEIAPGLVHPVSGKNMLQLLEECVDTGTVDKM